MKDKWERRQLEARQRKSKRDKCQCRIQGVPHSSLSEMDKKTMANALQVLPVEVTMSTEESGEEDNPFNQGEQMAVKVSRPEGKQPGNSMRYALKMCPLPSTTPRLKIGVIITSSEQVPDNNTHCQLGAEKKTLPLLLVDTETNPSKTCFILEMFLANTVLTFIGRPSPPTGKLYFI
ncbi:UNVERIFIED_CONTAM: hypothetical protein FKN15_066225 [Acipenser sinensis]